MASTYAITGSNGALGLWRQIAHTLSRDAHPPLTLPSLARTHAGFIASHLVKSLLEQGHSIRATVRHDPDAPQLDCLKQLQAAHPNKLTIFKVEDLTKADSLVEVFKGCNGIFHMAAVVRSLSLPKPLPAECRPSRVHMVILGAHPSKRTHPALAASLSSSPPPSHLCSPAPKPDAACVPRHHRSTPSTASRRRPRVAKLWFRSPSRAPSPRSRRASRPASSAPCSPHPSRPSSVAMTTRRLLRAPGAGLRCSIRARSSRRRRGRRITPMLSRRLSR